MNTEHTNQPRQAEPATHSPFDLQSIPERQRGFTAENIRDIAHECMRIGDNEQAAVVFAIADALRDGNLIIQPPAQQQAEPVAWEVSATKGDMPRQTKLLKHEAAALAAADHWKLVGCDVAVRSLVYAQTYAAQPPAVAMAVPQGWSSVPQRVKNDITGLLEDTAHAAQYSDHAAGVKADHELAEACKLLVAALAAAQQGAAEGCGACGDGCQGQGCRLERESPPTCQKCNGKGMIGGLLPNGGGYDGEPCPDCNTTQAAVAAPKAPTWYKRSDIVKALERMNYHTAIADELADWFLRHMQLAFNRGFYQAHGPAAATQLEELELWHLLERATGELTRRAAPHVWEQIAWKAGAEFIEQRRARLAAAQKGGEA